MAVIALGLTTSACAGVSGSPFTAPTRATTVEDLAGRLGKQQAADSTVSFSMESTTDSDPKNNTAATGAFRITANGTDARYDLTAPSRERGAKVIVIGSDFYSLDTPPKLPTPWNKLNTSQADPLFPFAVQAWLTRPEMLLSAFIPVGPTDAGSDNNGLVRYQLRSKDAASAIQLPGAMTGGAQAYIKGNLSVTLDLTVDDRDRLTTATATISTQQVKGYALHYIFHDWGKPVDIAAPPADQVSSR